MVSVDVMSQHLTFLTTTSIALLLLYESHTCGPHLPGSHEINEFMIWPPPSTVRRYP